MAIKKAVFFTIDSLLASGIIIIAILLVSNFYSVEQQRINVNYASQDLVRVFSTITVGEVNNDYVKSLIASGEIRNINNTVLEQIGEFWAEDQIELAKNFTKNMTESVVPKRFGLGVYADGEEIYLRNKSIVNNLVSSRKMISGIAKAKPIEGFSSRAFLSKITSKTITRFYPFDVIAPCYNSMWDPANADKISIDYSIELPSDANITNATWVIVTAIANTRVDAYINGNRVFSGIPDDNGIRNAQGNFTPGINRVKYNQTVTWYGGCAGDDGTSHVILTYKTSQLQTIDNKTKFPFSVVSAQGRVSDYEKPIFAPNTAIGKINISLNLNASQVFLRFRLKGTEFGIGNKTVTNKRVEWRDDEIRNNLSSKGISYSNLTDTYFYFIFDFRPQFGNVTIFGNSSVIIEGTQTNIPFGFIDISQPINLKSQNNASNLGSWCPNSYYDVDYNFSLPTNATHLYADWLIAWCWGNDADQIARANGINLYRHIEGNYSTDPFIPAFARFGYTKNVAPGSVKTGSNLFSLHFGSDYATRPTPSYGENVFLIPNSITYSQVSQQAEGCTWKVKADQGGIITIKVPNNYVGGNNCTYNNTNIMYSSNDSLQIAALGIFELLDFDDDGDIDVLISEDDTEIETVVISKVSSLWGPAIIEIRVWE